MSSDEFQPNVSTSALVEEFSVLFSSHNVTVGQRASQNQEYSLEQPPLYPYVQTFTTYGVSQEIIR